MTETLRPKLAIVRLEKLGHSQQASTVATRGALSLMERNFCRFVAGSWDSPTFAAMHGDRCVGVLVFREDDRDLTVCIELAYVEPEWRGTPVFAGLCSALRAAYRGSRFTAIDFMFHEGNADMAAIARQPGVVIRSHAARVAL
jgi:hypothetical protein